MSIYARIGMAVILICALSLGMGCTIAKISGAGEVPLILNQPQANIEVIEKFKHSKHIVFDYTNAFDVSEILRDIMVPPDADAIINLRITLKTNFIDFFCNLFTLGFAASKHIEISGTAVRAPDGLSFLPGPEVEMLAQSASIDQFTTFVEKDTPGTSIAILRDGSTGKADDYKLVRLDDQP